MIALYVDGRVDLDASVPTVEAAVHSLDGAERTLLVAELPSGATITVGGGPEKFVVEVAARDNARWTALDPRSPAGTIALTVDGEHVEAPARLCVDRDAAWEAVRTFVSENGARSPRLQWSAET